MAKHEGIHDRYPEHARKRARGGETGEPELESEFTAQEAKDAEHPEPENEAERRHGGRLHRGKAEHETEKEREDREKREKEEEKRRRGGRIGHKKAGGKVHGEHPKARPDRRARGGATADLSPLTAAGKMSRTSYETPPQTGSRGDEGGEGNDRGDRRD